MMKKKRADPAPAIPILIVQEIAVEWSKQSRGGAEAALRNAVAEVAELPFQPRTPKLMAVQTVGHRQVYQEKIGFALPAMDALVLDPALPEKPRKGHCTSTCVFVTRTAEGASLEFEYDYCRCGMPRREQVRKTLTLTLNQWVQVAYNGRFASLSSDWRYEKHVFNVGLFDAEAVTSDLFLRVEPTASFSAIALLI